MVGWVDGIHQVNLPLNLEGGGMGRVLLDVFLFFHGEFGFIWMLQNGSNCWGFYFS